MIEDIQDVVKWVRIDPKPPREWIIEYHYGEQDNRNNGGQKACHNDLCLKIFHPEKVSKYNGDGPSEDENEPQNRTQPSFTLEDALVSQLK